jgi:hypothetical protein
MIIFPAILFSQIKSPVVEDVRDVEFNAAETSEKFKASVTIYGKGVINGEIFLNAGAVINPSMPAKKLFIQRYKRITVMLGGRE